MARRSSFCPRRNCQPRYIVQSSRRWIQWNHYDTEVTGRFPFIRKNRYARTGFIYFIVLLSVISSLLMLLMIIFREKTLRSIFVQFGTSVYSM